MRALRAAPGGPKSGADMGVDVIDIVAIILGVLFTIRKLDAQKRLPREFPHVEAAAFENWQQTEVSVFGAAMIASFGKVFLDFGFLYFVAGGMSEQVVRRIGMTIDLSWLLVMLITFFRSMALSRMRTQLRIVLGGFVVESGTELSTELKGALRHLQDGDLERAAYELRQVTLDADGSLRGIALYWLGECLLRQGQTDAARDAFLESLEVDPTLKQPRDSLAQLAERESTSSN